MIDRRHRQAYPLSQEAFQTSTLPSRQELPNTDSDGRDISVRMLSRQTMLSFTSKFHISILSPVRQVFLGSIYKIFSNQRPPSIICFSNRKFTQGNTHTFFGLLKDWESTYALLKEKKNLIWVKVEEAGWVFLPSQQEVSLFFFPFFFLGLKFCDIMRNNKRLLHKSSKC